MDSNIESHITGLRDYLKDILETIKSSSLRGLWDQPQSILYLNPALRKVKTEIKVWEDKTKPVDWTALDPWIEEVVDCFRDELLGYKSALVSLGYKEAEIDMGNLGEVREMIKVAPKTKRLLRRLYGPNWFANREKLNNHGNIPNTNGSSLSLRKAASDRGVTILHHWDALHALKEKGALARFRELWMQREKLERRTWLQKHYPWLQNRPYDVLCKWAESSELGRNKLPQLLFMTSLLNTESLSEDMVLPDFLDARANQHPRVFRSTDSSSVHLGLYEGVLKLRGSENILFKLAGNQEYGISFQDQNHADPNTVYPGIPIALGTLQLEAQSGIYKFLASCPEEFINDFAQDERKEVVSNQHRTSDDCLPLLTRFLRLGFYGRPDVVDLDFLRIQLQTSLDKALDDLWQLREDPESWLERWSETAAKTPGRTSNMLSAVFRRIGIFQSLRRFIDEYARPGTPDDYSTTAPPTDMKFLYTALHSSLNEALIIVGEIQWSPDDNGSTFSHLFRLLKANDPVIRLMQLSQVMGVIDQEIREKKVKEVPIPVMQVIDDISVLACCVTEAFKLYNLQEDTFIDHGSEIDEFEEKWEKRDCPWMTTAAKTLAAMGEQLHRKLDHRSGSVSGRQRFFEFWTNVDKYMKISCQETEDKEVVDMIQQNAPVIDLLEKTQFETSITHNALLEISNTRLRQSRPRRPDPRNERPSVSSSEKGELHRPAAIQPTTDLELWDALTAPSIENNSTFRWPDFCKMMHGIGYRIIPQAGSAYRFEDGGRGNAVIGDAKLRTIVFHAPHPSDKLTHRDAQQWWLPRLLSRYEIILKRAHNDGGAAVN